MIYIDTSVLVASFTAETSTLAAQAWLAKHQNHQLAISPWVKTEFYSAMAMKRRLKEISDLAFAEISTKFIEVERDTFYNLAISQAHFQEAAKIVAQHMLKLRAADALHLAIAAENGATLCTLDQTLFDAGTALSIACVMP